MKHAKHFIVGTILALPLVCLLFYLFNPPQCPLDYTQAQIDGSRCIVGANIGGMPLFIVTSIIVWILAIWLVKKFGHKEK